MELQIIVYSKHMRLLYGDMKHSSKVLARNHHKFAADTIQTFDKPQMLSNRIFMKIKVAISMIQKV